MLQVIEYSVRQVHYNDGYNILTQTDIPQWGYKLAHINDYPYLLYIGGVYVQFTKNGVKFGRKAIATNAYYYNSGYHYTKLEVAEEIAEEIDKEIDKLADKLGKLKFNLHKSLHDRWQEME